MCPNGERGCVSGRPAPICLSLMITGRGEHDQAFGCSWWNGMCWGFCGWGGHNGLGYRREYCGYQGVPFATTKDYAFPGLRCAVTYHMARAG